MDLTEDQTVLRDDANTYFQKETPASSPRTLWRVISFKNTPKNCVFENYYEVGPKTHVVSSKTHEVSLKMHEVGLKTLEGGR